MYEEIKHAIIDGDTDEAQELTEKALQDGMGAAALVDNALVPAMDKVAEMWQEGEYFMSDVILCANAFSTSMEMITPALEASGAKTIGKFMIGVVEGDLHDLGKNIVVAMLRANGFEVIDLGVDVPVTKFVEAVREEKPDILGVGAYMSTTIPQITDVVSAVKAAGCHDGLKIVIGGVCVNDAIATACGADAYGGAAMSTVSVAKNFMGVA